MLQTASRTDDQRIVYPARMLSQCLTADRNNLNLVRLIASLAVIGGHAYALAPHATGRDLVQDWLSFDYSGSLAVKTFFFISGLLVTHSIERDSRPFSFLLKRAIRIFPALTVCMFLSAFIAGTILTTMPAGTYLTDHETWRYFFGNATLLDIQWRLPGVFDDSKYGFNGSIWTLPGECQCYLFLAGFSAVGLLSSRLVATACFVAVVVTSLFAPTYLPKFGANPDAFLLPACFALGCLLSLHSRSIKLSYATSAMLWIIFLMIDQPQAKQYIFYGVFFYTTLVFATSRLVVERLQPPYDASYGIYLYGFPTQVFIGHTFPNLGTHAHQVLSMAIALVLGTLSWFGVERPALLGRRYLTHPRIGAWLMGTVFHSRRQLGGALKLANASRVGELTALFCVVLMTYCLVLRFVFPGYLSPLWPHHIDFYIPPALAGGPIDALSYWSWPRPVGIMFYVLIGNLGTRGAMAAVIVLTLANAALTTFLFRRVCRLSLSWVFLLGVALYSFLLFSSPYFYVFYAQDAFAQLSFFWLLLAGSSWYYLAKTSWLGAGLLMFGFGLLAFLSKETYALSALGISGLMTVLTFRSGRMRACLPPVILAASLLAALAMGVVQKSMVFGLGDNPAAQASYHVSLSLASIGVEWLRYASGGVNILTALALAMAMVLIGLGDVARERMIMTLACLVAAFLAWLPNSLLPLHYFAGYSWSGAYILFLPIILGVCAPSKLWIRATSVLTLSLIVLVSPVRYQDSYASNSWVLLQEKTQRNLLPALGRVIRELPLDKPEHVLVTGINFPFSPFAHPGSLTRTIGGRQISFDLVTYSGPRDATGPNVAYVMPADVRTGSYDKIWTFAPDGTLVSDLAAPTAEPADPENPFSLTERDRILYPGIDGAVKQADGSGDAAPNLMREGDIFLSYGEQDRAYNLFKKSADIQPTNPYPLFDMGSILKTQGKFEEAETALARAVELGNNPYFSQLLAEVRHELLTRKNEHGAASPGQPNAHGS